MKKIIISSVLISGLSPFIAFATNNTFRDLVAMIMNNVLGPLVPLLISLTILVFIWGIIKFIKNADSKEREEGKRYMFWGIIGIFVMVSLWGLVNILQNSFNLNPNSIDIVNMNDIVN